MNDSSYNLQGALTYSINNTPLYVGKYYITTSGLTARNYQIVNTVGTLTITKAPLVIRADNITKIFDTQSIKISLPSGRHPPPQPQQHKLSISCEFRK